MHRRGAHARYSPPQRPPPTHPAASSARPSAHVYFPFIQQHVYPPRTHAHAHAHAHIPGSSIRHMWIGISGICHRCNCLPCCLRFRFGAFWSSSPGATYLMQPSSLQTSSFSLTWPYFSTSCPCVSPSPCPLPSPCFWLSTAALRLPWRQVRIR